MEIEIIQALLHCVENYPNGSENKNWFIKLFHNSLNGQQFIEVDTDLIYNATNLENLLAKILKIDIKTIVKLRMVQNMIVTLWKDSQWDLNELNRYTLNEKPVLENNDQHYQNGISINDTMEDQPTTLQTDHPITVQQPHTSSPQMIQPIETPEDQPIEEINMLDSDQYSIANNNNDDKQIIVENHVQYQTKTPIYDIIGEDISTIKYYNVRNRKLNPINPFFITEKANYKLGTLAISVPGEEKKEQLAFVANILKLPSNSSLINFESFNGNLWITAGFEYEDDLIFCKDKMEKKNNTDFIDFIQLKTENKETKYEKKVNKKSNFKTEENESNKFNITNSKTRFKAGIPIKNIPGANRREKINSISEMLDLDPNDDLFSHTTYKNENWITIYFKNSDDLNHCIKETSGENKQFAMTVLPTKTKREEGENSKCPQKNRTVTNMDNKTQQTYRIQDIPKEYSINRIKGALKPYGKVVNINTITNAQQKQEKEIQVTLIKNTQSKDIENLWSIPIGPIMARVAPTEECPEIWVNRRQFSARLYGIPKNASAVLLMRAIKNLKPKTCYIPKCSKTGKERSFAIVSFQTKKDLDKACISATRYHNSILTWSKSRTQHLQNMISIHQRNRPNKTNSVISSEYMEEIQHIETNNQHNTKQITSPSISTLSFLSTTPPASSDGNSISFKKRNKKNEKGKGKIIYSNASKDQKANTTDKLIALISQISSRLDYIEGNMEKWCNRS